jgi:hypothetical protein
VTYHDAPRNFHRVRDYEEMQQQLHLQRWSRHRLPVNEGYARSNFGKVPIKLRQWVTIFGLSILEVGLSEGLHSLSLLIFTSEPYKDLGFSSVAILVEDYVVQLEHINTRHAPLTDPLPWILTFLLHLPTSSNTSMDRGGTVHTGDRAFAGRRTALTNHNPAPHGYRPT